MCFLVLRYLGGGMNPKGGFKIAPASNKNNSRHCYSLYSTESIVGPVALCLTYTWNRNLDGRDETRGTETPDENPGAKAVNLPGSS